MVRKFLSVKFLNHSIQCLESLDPLERVIQELDTFLTPKTRRDKKIDVRNSVWTFVGFSTWRNVHGEVILTVIYKWYLTLSSRHLKITILRIQDWRLGNPDEGDSDDDDGGLIQDMVQDDDILPDDDTESSDDDVVDKTVEEMHQVLVKVPPFNPLFTEEARKLKSLPIPTVMN